MALMKQQVMLKPAQGTAEPAEIIFRDIEIPEPKEGEVLIKMKRIGICGSDIHVYYGEHSGTGYPVTRGMRRIPCRAEGYGRTSGRMRRVLSVPSREV